MQKFEYDTTRVNYNLPTKLVNRVKEYSKEMGVPITYGVVLLLNKGLDSEKSLNAMTKINEMYEDFKNGKFNTNDTSEDSVFTTPTTL